MYLAGSLCYGSTLPNFQLTLEAQQPIWLINNFIGEDRLLPVLSKTYWRRIIVLNGVLRKIRLSFDNKSLKAAIFVIVYI